MLFAGAVVVGQELTLLGIAALIKHSFPRLSAVLSLAGVIVDHPIAGSTIDRAALAHFLRDPPALIDEQFWDDLFAADDIDGTGRLPAMLLALLLLAPDTIGAMRRGELRLAPLEPPPVGDAASPSWRALRERSRGWIPIVFPLRVGDDGRLALGRPDGPGRRPPPPPFPCRS